MKELKYNYVYKITNLINNKIYIGVHGTDNIDDGYMGSGSALKNAKNKYGIENFKKEILRECDTYTEALKYEKELVTLEFCNERTNYNLQEGGIGGRPNEDTKKKISKSRIENCSAKGVKNPMYGKVHTQSSKELMSIKQSVPNKNKARNVKGINGPMYGNRHSKETLEIMREKRYGKSCKYVYCITTPDDLYYENITSLKEWLINFKCELNYGTIRNGLNRDKLGMYASKGYVFSRELTNENNNSR